MFETIDMNKFWNVIDEIDWTIKNGRKYLKIWVRYENLQDFINLLNLSNHDYVCKGTILNDSLYIEIENTNVCEFVGVSDIDDFIQKNGIEKN